MPTTKCPEPLQERIPIGSTIKKAVHLAILFLQVLLLLYRVRMLPRRGLPWFLALLCESWITFVWLQIVNMKWNPVIRRTHPARLRHRFEDLPSVDLFITTADPELEPPIVTVNTVLSLLALDYPQHKLACYVSDDACSFLTYRALVEALEFAKSWVPFCRKNGVGIRTPRVYFSHDPEPHQLLSPVFLKDWRLLKDGYEQLREKIEGAAGTGGDDIRLSDKELSQLPKIDRGDHPSIVRIIWENKGAGSAADGVPHLIYVAREKRPRHQHHYKAGAMNALTRVSGVMTNAPFMLNVDCDAFARNPQVLLHAMCLLLGFEDETASGFVQCPQRFDGGLKDDPFGNQFVVSQRTAGLGMDGIQGPSYLGTGCVHRRKAIYGAAPNAEHFSPPVPKLERTFGSSRELVDSAAAALMGGRKRSPAGQDLSLSVSAAKEVSSCTYELGTSWGQEVGFVYGSMTEDVQTALRIHGKGWCSVICSPEPPGFVGSSPIGGPETLAQIKRWSTGLLEVLLNRNSPFLMVVSGKLRLRQCLCYLALNVWALRSLPELCYALLPPYCIVANTSFLPKATEASAIIPASILVLYNVLSLVEYLQCGLSVRAWWNNQRMLRITSSTAWLFGFISVVLKVLGISETTFEITRKDETSQASEVDVVGADPGRFTFDASPLFVPATALVLLNLLALVVGSFKILLGTAGGSAVNDGPGMGELVCSAWVVLSFWPFVRGLFLKGRYGIPWPTVCKASVLGSIFLLGVVHSRGS